MDKKSLLARLNSPWSMSFFLFWKLPGAWFMGVRAVSCDAQKGVVALPYGWRSQNPFRSTYFAAQCAAGEFSTGMLGLLAMQDRPKVSMLVTRVESEFYKKADQTLIFTCNQGKEVHDAIEHTLQTGESVVLRMQSDGVLPNGVLASTVWITWSFKRK